MRKFLAVTLVLGFVLAFVFPHEAECRKLDNLYGLLSQKKVVKTYVEDIEDSTEAGKAEDVALKDTLENDLKSRQTMKFELVQGTEDADIVISCNLVEFIWMKEDPVDQIGGVGPVLYDVMVKESHARLQAYFTVTDPKTNKVLWEKKLKATVDEKDMSEEDSLSAVNERLVKIFIRECFGKKKSERRYLDLVS